MKAKYLGLAALTLTAGLAVLGSISKKSEAKLSSDVMWRYVFFTDSALSTHGVSDAPVVFRELNNVHHYHQPVTRFKVISTRWTNAETLTATVEATYDDRVTYLIESLDSEAKIMLIQPNVLELAESPTIHFERTRSRDPLQFIVTRKVDQDLQKRLKELNNGEASEVNLPIQYLVPLCEGASKCENQAIGNSITIPL